MSEDNTTTTRADELTVEHAELNVKHAKLRAFMVSDEYDEIDADERALLSVQEQHMAGYLTVLAQRIERATTPTE